MNAVQRAAVIQDLRLHADVRDLVDDRTLEILERRRRTSVIRRRGWLVRRMLLAADIAGLVVALLISEWIVNAHSANGALDARGETLVFLATLPVWVVIAKLYGLYDRDEERTDHSTTDEFAGVFHMLTVCTWVFAVCSWTTGVAHPTAPKLMIFWAAAIPLVSFGRAAARAIARRSVLYLQNAVIVGAGDVGQMIAAKILHHPEYGINVVGFIDDEPKGRRDDLAHLALLGGRDQLQTVVECFDVERVIVAFSNDSQEETVALIRAIRELDVQIDIVPRLYEIVGPEVGFHAIEGLTLLGLGPMRLSRSSQLLKRTTDIVLSSVALVALAPVLVVCAAAIVLDSRGPVLFSQIRMGEAGKPFRILKFRTMVADADLRKSEVAHLNEHLTRGSDPRMFKISNDPRTTRVGRFLRRYSIDELPQLLNVLRGEMSLVGPRPLILDEDRFVADWARERLRLKPGITGYWQVLGRHGISFDEMVRLDYVYVTNWTPFADLKLMFRTLAVVAGVGRGC